MNAQMQSTPRSEAEWNKRYAEIQLRSDTDHMLRNVTDVARRLRRTADEVDRIVERLAAAVDDEEKRRYQTILEQAMQVQSEVLNAMSNMRFDLIAKYAASVTNNLERSTNKE